MTMLCVLVCLRTLPTHLTRTHTPLPAHRNSFGHHILLRVATQDLHKAEAEDEAEDETEADDEAEAEDEAGAEAEGHNRCKSSP